MRYRQNKKKEAFQLKLILFIPAIITLWGLTVALGWMFKGYEWIGFIIAIPVTLLSFYILHKKLLD